MLIEITVKEYCEVLNSFQLTPSRITHGKRKNGLFSLFSELLYLVLLLLAIETIQLGNECLTLKTKKV